MLVVEHSVTSAPPEAVWNILADVEHWSEWTPTIIKIEPLTSAGMAVGARYRITQPKLQPAIYEVTDFIPNRLFTWVHRVPGGGLIAGHHLHPRDRGTDVEHSYTSKGILANVLALLFSKTIRAYVATEAKSLEGRCRDL